MTFETMKQRVGRSIASQLGHGRPLKRNWCCSSDLFYCFPPSSSIYDVWLYTFLHLCNPFPCNRLFVVFHGKLNGQQRSYIENKSVCRVAKENIVKK